MTTRHIHRLSCLLIGCFLGISMAHADSTALDRKLNYLRSFEIHPNGDAVFCLEEICHIYEEKQYREIWSQYAMADSFLRFISSVERHGLEPADYHYGILSKRIGNWEFLSEGERAETELLLTDAYLLLCTHLRSGKLDPVSLDPKWHFRPAEKSELRPLAELMNYGYSRQCLESLAPVFHVYHLLQTAVDEVLDLSGPGNWRPLPDGDLASAYGVGDSAYWLPDVRFDLGLWGDLPLCAHPDYEGFDRILEFGIASFQKRHGLAVDGRIGKETYRMLQESPGDRLWQLKANLERWKWVNMELQSHYVLVNIADFTAEYYRNNRFQRMHRVIAGKEERETPVFAARMNEIVFNPTWTVPPTILKEDILPKLKAGGAYVRQKGIQPMKNGAATDLSSVQWNASNIHQYSWVQGPGPSNALGMVKLMFPNPYMVYLHDTPSRNLFNETERTFSSGCIRVEDPLELAEAILDDPAYGMPEIRSIIESNKTRAVRLQETPMVFILYWTAWMSKDSRLQFRKDVYNRDGKVIQALKSSAEAESVE